MTHEPPVHTSRAESVAVSANSLGRMYQGDSESVWAVRDVSFQVTSGQFVCIFGPSGSGKSTLLSVLAGLELPTTGTVEIFGQPIQGLDEDARARLRLHEVGVVFQDHHLIEEFTALENVMLPLEARGIRPSDARTDAMAQLAAVGIETLADRLPSKLSGGQRQRVGIARALVGGRRVLMADEPTGALDSANTDSLFRLLRSLCDTGTTVLMATHEVGSRSYADAVLEMTDGQLCTSQERR